MSEAPRETSRALTQGIRVEARSRYLFERSMPSDRHYAFEYTVRIQNVGSVAAQLIGRHWLVTDAKGDTQDVRGAGVVGEQPILHPGQYFEYSSNVVLQTSHGSMRGSFVMHSVLGKTFEAAVAPFLLSLPHTLN